MPYQRTVRYASPLLAWHDIVLAESAPQWSDLYCADSPRLFVPASRWIEAEQGGGRFVCDALSPLWLAPEAPYRMRQPFEGQRSVVLIFHDAAGIGPAPRAGGVPRRPLRPSEHWALADCRARLARGALDRLAFEEALLALWPADGDALPARANTVAGGAWLHQASATAGARARRRYAQPHRAVERARELLASDPAADLSLHELARAVACSPFHLARRFRLTTGLGLHAYRTRLRLALALARIGEGERDLTQLALELGFSSHSHFSARFRACYGVPPRQVRSNLTAPPRP